MNKEKMFYEITKEVMKMSQTEYQKYRTMVLESKQELTEGFAELFVKYMDAVRSKVA